MKAVIALLLHQMVLKHFTLRILHVLKIIIKIKIIIESLKVV
jgi:hypothetical protein